MAAVASTFGFTEEHSALVKAAHEEPDVQRVLEAYKVMEEAGKSQDHLWVEKHVQSDGSTFGLHTDEASAFGHAGINVDWELGPIRIKCQVDPAKGFLEAGIWLNYFSGTKEFVVKGDLSKGMVSGPINFMSLIKGHVTFYRKGKELWMKLELGGPMMPEMDRDLKLMDLCEFG